MAKWPGFVGGSGVTQSPIANAEDTINFYVERLQTGRQDIAAALFPTPGFQSWGAVADVGTRAALYANGRLFQVIGGNLYEFDASGTPTLRGGVGVDGNPAQIIYNGVVAGQLGIVSAGAVYSYDLTSNAAPSVRLSGGYTHLCFAGGYGLALNPSTGFVRISNLGDLTVWDAGTFFERQLFADPYQAMFVDKNNLVWMLGTDTFEVRYNNGVDTQPFVPLPGLIGAHGIVAPFAFSISALGAFWLSRNTEGAGQLVATTGTTPQSVSSYSFSTAVAGYERNARIDDAELLTYQQAGHTFVAVTFPSAQITSPTAPTTWVLDPEGQSWTKRGRWVNGAWQVWSPRVHVYAFGKHLIGDRTTGHVSVMDTAYATEVDGLGIVRERTAPGLVTESQRVAINQVELLVESGVGTLTDDGVDPQAVLTLSTDGGRTWSNERPAGLGRMGEFGRRLVWRMLGASAHHVLRVRFSAPVPVRVLDAYINNAPAGAAA